MTRTGGPHVRPKRLIFTTGRLAGLFVVTALGAFLMGALTLKAVHTGRVYGFIRIFGPELGAWVMGGLTLVCALCSGVTLQRLFGDRIALAVRDDGILVNGFFSSRLIPWPQVAGIRINTLRYRRGEHHYIKVDCRERPSGVGLLHHLVAELGSGTPIDLVGLDLAGAHDWIGFALAEWRAALQPRQARAPDRTHAPPASGRPAGFGRRGLG